ncbi:carboxylesterase BioH (pimeloyl-CoA synthesis) [Plasticicumulans lactativorans]|uniref:Pimeloyl-[acyl-carrier protein] methyl ester esterase n=1 Tax=Plasticicumulans lactativorans TaxID=1133106 RepID=A0A4R2LBF4_9GAMM|nr:pimeloyl-ACP methyl ester esterase BioH [Plasticicumulans lactativorans]TCO80128.1 carboxylesterase BioH (pimeloyl-CoA synthesis) [Plasticicumulans lactativorans]
MSGPLYVRHYGAGPDLVLLHGWGMHAGVWEDVIEGLVDDWRVTVLDLPGHGRSRGLPLGDLATLAATVAAHAPRHASWIGWSLGGLVAQRIALDHPARVRRLVLVGANACFGARPDWPHGMAAETLEQFAANLAQDYRATLKRFIALEVLDSDNAAEQLRRLREIVFEHGAPDPAALADGLAILGAADLRHEWPRLALPVRLLAGRRDKLVPAAAAAALAQLAPDARAHVFERAGHAPFFSHPEAFLAALRSALHD